MIENLKLRNFKSIQSDTVEFKPLTILTGPNSSGKSNIVQSIAIVSQIARTAQNLALDFPSHLELTDAEYYRYPKPSIEFVVYKGELEREIEIEINLWSRTSNRSVGYSIKYNSEKKQTEQNLLINHHLMFGVISTISKERSTSVFKHPLRWKGENTEEFAQNLLTPRVFSLRFDQIQKKKEPARKVDVHLRELASNLTDDVRKELQKIYLILAPRGIIPMETTAGPDPSWVGKNGEHLIYILSKIFGQSKYKEIQKKISSWSTKFGLGPIGAGLKKQTFLTADFEDPTLKATFDINSASYGSRQLLTIITQIFWSKLGDILLIEEPEISLHPESQALVQELFAEAVSEGKQVICTTHSPSFILSLSKVIGRKMLNIDDVAIYHVDKKIEGTKTRRLELNNRGFVKGWIPSYIDAENNLFKDWVESLE